ncbi:MAG TPA: PhaM family polyhydroxyalkanoate granule multifunctional regulatory protein, partial [Burkholderiaceae bacterium]|nr:PhaM family polyhydroxyalkanoate granule multifunctional regulatory protein [Burkholderiaceae bacterium]
MADSSSFSKFVPGFEFLQGLVKNAGAALPGIGQWVAPTLNPEELSKRIEELRTVQFWLEQNARMLGATIQALEVQRMTLSTLKSMNVPLTELSETLKVPSMPEYKLPEMPGMAAPAPKARKPAAKASPKSAEPPSPAGLGAVDPMQWWSALSNQFTQLATQAMKDGATDAAKNLAGAMVKQSFDAAGETIKKAAAVPLNVAKSAAAAAGAA